MKSILRKQMLDQQQLQDYEANAHSSAQAENLPEDEMLRFHERQNPERPELRGLPINFGFIDKILQVWYFVIKIVLTYREKKCSCDIEFFLKFLSFSLEFAKFLRSLEQFI